MSAGFTFSKRARDMEPFRVVQLLERAKALEREGGDIVHFEVGEPDFSTANVVVSAGIRSLERGMTGYTQALGIPEFRGAIADHYRVDLGVDIDPDRIVVTTGASGALNLVTQLLVEAGDGVLMTDPGYPCNAKFVEAAGGVAQRVPVGSQDGYQMTVELAKAHWTQSSRGMLLASPSNPTGAILRRDEFALLMALARAHGGFVVVDEIYQGLVYDDLPDELTLSTCLTLDDDFFVINSFSKYFGMTGWRLGWAVVPEAAIGVIGRIAQNLYISPPTMSQYAACAAFSAEAMAEHERRRLAFQSRRDRLIAGLESIGLAIAHHPYGAFYVYTDISKIGMDAETFCWRLIDEFGVAVTPGADFGTHRASNFVRFAYTTGEDRIDLGIRRLARAVDALGQH